MKVEQSVVDFLLHPASITLLCIAFVGLVLRLAVWYGAVNSERLAFREGLTHIFEELKYLRERIDEMFSRQVGKVADSASPQKLNELGRKLSDEFGSAAWAEAHAAEAHAELVSDDMTDMMPYDVQEFCFGYVTKDRLSEEELQRAKEVAFNNGLLVSHVLRVTAFELRDRLLTQE